MYSDLTHWGCSFSWSRNLLLVVRGQEQSWMNELNSQQKRGCNRPSRGVGRESDFFPHAATTVFSDWSVGFMFYKAFAKFIFGHNGRMRWVGHKEIWGKAVSTEMSNNLDESGDQYCLCSPFSLLFEVTDVQMSIGWQSKLLFDLEKLFNFSLSFIVYHCYSWAASS